MVHALHRLHRALKPGGALIDLRPAIVNRRISLLYATPRGGRRWRTVGNMDEDFADDHAADHAIRQVWQDRLFRRERRARLMVHRYLDSLEDLDEFANAYSSLVVPDDVMARAREWWHADTRHKMIVVSAPLTLTVWRKIG